MQILRDSIILQKENYSKLVNEVDYYKIKDPIMHNYSYQVLYILNNLAVRPMNIIRLRQSLNISMI